MMLSYILVKADSEEVKGEPFSTTIEDSGGLIVSKIKVGIYLRYPNRKEVIVQKFKLKGGRRILHANLPKKIDV